MGIYAMIKQFFGLLCPKPLATGDHDLMWRPTNMVQNTLPTCHIYVLDKSIPVPMWHPQSQKIATKLLAQVAPMPNKIPGSSSPFLARHAIGRSSMSLCRGRTVFLSFLQQGKGIGISTSFKYDGSCGWSNA